MPPAVRPIEPADVPVVVDFAVRAWEPVFESLERVLGHDMFAAMHEGGWRPIQARAVEEACTSAEMTTWVADDAGAPIGFVTVELRPEDREGEIYMIAVDPSAQQRGVGALLTDHAVEWIAEQGVQFAVVATGGHPGHAPARATYEAAGFTLLPLARYYKAL